MYEIKEINYQQQKLNEIDVLSTLMQVLVKTENYQAMQECLDKQQQSLDECKRVENERKTRMKALRDSLQKDGIKAEVVNRV